MRMRGDRLRWVEAALVGVILSASSPVFAEGVGSPASILKKGKWAMGLAGGGTGGRDLSGGAKAKLYHMEHYRGYGLTDRLSIYAKLGVAFLEVNDASIKKTNNPDTSNSFGTNVISGVQLKGKLFESQKHRWEWDGSLQYLDIRARHKNKNEIRWHEVQFATSVAKEFGRVKPYLGVRYALVNAAYRVRQNGILWKQGRYKEDTPVGVFLGTDYYLGESEDVVLNVETAYQDGFEALASLGYTF